jgi:hypothetical protein
MSTSTTTTLDAIQLKDTGITIEELFNQGKEAKELLGKDYTVKELYTSGFYNRSTIEAASIEAAASFSSMCSDLGPKENDPDKCGKSSGGGTAAAVIIILILFALGVTVWRRKTSQPMQRGGFSSHGMTAEESKANNMRMSTRISMPPPPAGAPPTTDASPPSDDFEEDEFEILETSLIGLVGADVGLVIPPLPDLGAVVCREIALVDLAQAIEEMQQDDDFAFGAEYDAIEAGEEFSRLAAARSDLKKRNRYQNILAYDYNRVRSFAFAYITVLMCLLENGGSLRSEMLSSKFVTFESAPMHPCLEAERHIKVHPLPPTPPQVTTATMCTL